MAVVGTDGHGEATVLTVHGVGGASPQALLDDPDVRMVTGDDASGFWRPRSRPHLDGDGRVLREGLSWGGRTSGSWRNALWVLLLPFALVNLASWSHGPGEHPSRRLRLFAATLTVSAVLSSTVIWFDTVAIACGAVRSCVEGTPLLTPLTWEGADGPLFLGRPERRLTLMVLFPLALLTLFWFAGWLGRRALEDYDPRTGPRPTATHRVDLLDADFWRGTDTAKRTRGLHLTIGRTAIAVSLAVCLLAVVEGDLARAVLWGALAVFAGTLLVAVTLTMLDAPYARGHDPFLPAPLRVAGELLARRGAGADTLGHVDVLLVKLRSASWISLAAVVGVGVNGLLPIPVVVLAWVVGVLASLRDVAHHRRVLRAGQVSVAASLQRWMWGVAGTLFAVMAVLGRLDEVPVTEPTLRATGNLAGLFAPAWWPLLAVGTVQGLLLLWLALRPSSPPRTARSDDGDVPGAGERDPVLARGHDRPFAGRLPFVTSMLALFMVTTFAAGLHLVVADVLGALARPWQIGVAEAAPPEGVTSLALPYWYEATAIVLVLVVGALGLLALVAFQRLSPADDPVDAADSVDAAIADAAIADAAAPDGAVPRTPPGPLPDVGVGRGRLLAAVLDQLRRDPDVGPPATATATGPVADRLLTIARNWRVHALVLDVDRLMVRGMVVLGLLATLLVVAQTPALWDGACADGCGLLGRSLGPLARVALAFTAALPLLAVPVLRNLTRDAAARRQVAGVLWDVMTFWPRHGHPFAPPPYGERVIPQLRLRVDRLRGEGRTVVVAGHSQGSVIAAAAMAMPPFDAPGAARAPLPRLVTYGSPIGIIYERLFPAYFGPEFHARVRQHTGAWVNVLTLTDVFAYPLFPAAHRGDATWGDPVTGWRHPGGPTSDVGDVVLADPTPFAHPAGEQPDPAIGGHSAYHHHPAMPELLVAMARRDERGPAIRLDDEPTRATLPGG